MSHVTRTLVGLFALSAVVFPPIAHAREVKHCGITIAKGKTGRLIKDVQCGWHCVSDPTTACTNPPLGADPRCPLTQNDACLPDIITLEKNATLDLNGFTLTPVYQQIGIVCSPGGEGRCTIKGGTIQGGKEVPILGNDKDLVFNDLTVGLFYTSIKTTGWLDATNLTLGGCDVGGILASKGVRAKNVTLGIGCGLASPNNIVVDGVDADGWLSADGTLRVQNATVRFDSDGFHGRDVFLSHSTVLPYPGDDSVGLAIFAERRLVIRSSEMRGIQSGKKPKLIKSSCLESAQADGTSTWGVCSQD